MAYPIFAIPLAIVLSGTFRGFLYEGFEANEYVSCDAPMTMPAQLRLRAGGAQDFAVSALSSITARAGLAMNLSSATSLGGDHTLRYIEWRGRYTGPGYFSTWGLAPFGIEIDDLVVSRAPRVSDCPAVNRHATPPSFAFDTADVIARAWEQLRPLPQRKRVEFIVGLDFALGRPSVSNHIARALQRAGVPLRHGGSSLPTPDRLPQFALSDLWAMPDHRVRVVINGSWWTDLSARGSDRVGMLGLERSADTLFVRGMQ